MNCKWQRWVSLGLQLQWDFISIHLCRRSLQKIKRRFCLQSKSAPHRYIFITTLLKERKYCCRDTLTQTLLWRACTVFLRAAIHRVRCLSGVRWPKSDSTPGFHLPGGEVRGSCRCPDGSNKRESIVLMRSPTHIFVRVAFQPTEAWAQQQVLSNGIYHPTACCFPAGASFNGINVFHLFINLCVASSHFKPSSWVPGFFSPIRKNTNWMFDEEQQTDRHVPVRTEPF